MKMITSVCLLEEGDSYTASPFAITQEQVRAFGALTGDWNDHNEKAVPPFLQPTAQGFFTLALVARAWEELFFDKSVEVLNEAISKVVFLRQVPIGVAMTPVISVFDVKRAGDGMRVVWRYKLLIPIEEKLKVAVAANIVLRYYAKKHA
ncbi:MAG: MaoC like domain [Candidatus Taylorbacteria bacterium]|nr:MaoC like domain [Candidatus Taylorbacteria bacterium]